MKQLRKYCRGGGAPEYFSFWIIKNNFLFLWVCHESSRNKALIGELELQNCHEHFHNSVSMVVFVRIKSEGEPL